jgi:hypothetical protein
VALLLDLYWLNSTGMNLEREITKRFLLLMVEVIGPSKQFTTQGQFLKVVQATESSVKRWKDGAGNVTVNQIARACKYIGCSESWLISSRGDMFEKEATVIQLAKAQKQIMEIKRVLKS